MVKLAGITKTCEDLVVALMVFPLNIASIGPAASY